MESVVWRNIVKMFEYRGGVCETQQDPSGVAASLKNSHYILAVGKTRGDTFVVCMMGNIDAKKEHVASALKAINKLAAASCLIVFSKHPSPYIRNYLDGEARRQYSFGIVDCMSEIFALELPQNKLVPPHRIATQEEIDKIESAYIQKSSLPIIRENDPMAIWIGAKKGDVVIVERLSETAGQATAARYCR